MVAMASPIAFAGEARSKTKSDDQPTLEQKMHKEEKPPARHRKHSVKKRHHKKAKMHKEGTDGMTPAEAKIKKETELNRR